MEVHYLGHVVMCSTANGYGTLSSDTVNSVVIRSDYPGDQFVGISALRLSHVLSRRMYSGKRSKKSLSTVWIGRRQATSSGTSWTGPST